MLLEGTSVIRGYNISMKEQGLTYTEFFIFSEQYTIGWKLVYYAKQTLPHTAGVNKRHQVNTSSKTKNPDQ